MPQQVSNSKGLNNHPVIVIIAALASLVTIVGYFNSKEESKKENQGFSEKPQSYISNGSPTPIPKTYTLPKKKPLSSSPKPTPTPSPTLTPNLRNKATLYFYQLDDGGIGKASIYIYAISKEGRKVGGKIAHLRKMRGFVIELSPGDYMYCVSRSNQGCKSLRVESGERYFIRNRNHWDGERLEIRSGREGAAELKQVTLIEGGDVVNYHKLFVQPKMVSRE